MKLKKNKKMNKNSIKQRMSSCHCRCHGQNCSNHKIEKECTNLNHSQIIPEKIDRNNGQYSLNYNYDIPLYNPYNMRAQENCKNNLSRQELLLKEVKKEINKNIPNMDLNNNIKERAQVLKDKINSMFLLKRMNEANKSIKDELEIGNNINNNMPNKYTFYNKRGKTPFFRRQMQNELKIENPYLNKLLTNIPKHEKHKSFKRKNAENLKLLFTNGIFRMKSYDAQQRNRYNKKFKGYASMIMPPNDLCRIGLINNC